jgi:hypothetical protein
MCHLVLLMSQLPPKKCKLKKKFNHTALYTGIVSSRHSHLHVNNGPGSMAHQAHVPGECSQGSAAPVVLAQHRCGAHLRLTRRIMLWLFLCFVFCLSFFFSSKSY